MRGGSAHRAARRTPCVFSDGAIARCLADGGMDKSLLSAAAKKAFPKRPASDDHYYKIFRFTRKLQERFVDLPSSLYVNVLHCIAHLFTHSIKVRCGAGSRALRNGRMS